VADNGSIKKVSDKSFPVQDGPERGVNVNPACSEQPAWHEPSASIDEAELVRRARANDMWASDQLVRRYQKKVYGIAYRFCGFDPEEARDTTQEVFLQAFRNLSQFEGRSSFSTWLYRIAVNACLDAQRRRRRWVARILPWRAKRLDEKDAADPLDAFAAPEDGTDPISTLRGAELRRDVMKALRHLSEHQRTVFQLKVFEEMSIAEIAAVTGMADGTVKSHLFRATRTVRAQLRRWIER
jgi:RNA polymerase sigma-70 factor, ECF subfamily